MSVRDRNQIFEIVIGKAVTTSSPSKGLYFGSKQVKRGDRSQSQTTGSRNIDRSARGFGIPAIGATESSHVRRHDIQCMVTVAPTADCCAFSMVLFKPKRS